jgi:hypothetical protein
MANNAKGRRTVAVLSLMAWKTTVTLQERGSSVESTVDRTGCEKKRGKIMNAKCAVWIPLKKPAG